MMQFEKLKQRTFSNTWNNFEIKPKKISFLSQVLRYLKNYLKKFTKISIQIKKLDKIVDSSFGNKQIDKTLINKRNFLIQKKIIEFLNCLSSSICRSKLLVFLFSLSLRCFVSAVKSTVFKKSAVLNKSSMMTGFSATLSMICGSKLVI